MAKVERIREMLSEPLSEEYLRQKAEAGWKPVAVEWQREVERGEEQRAKSPGTLVEDVPYGLRIAEDCQHLAENPAEKEALALMMEQIVLDNSLSEIAGELNRRGFRTREGQPWTQTAVFNMLPRLIDAGPEILSGEEWAARRQNLALSSSVVAGPRITRQDRPRH